MILTQSATWYDPFKTDITLNDEFLELCMTNHIIWRQMHSLIFPQRFLRDLVKALGMKLAFYVVFFLMKIAFCRLTKLTYTSHKYSDMTLLDMVHF